MTTLSWLGYGGIDSTTETNYIKSLVVDEFTLKNAFRGALKVNGTLIVAENATFQSNIVVGNLRVLDQLSVQSLNVESSLSTDRDVNIGGNLRVLSGKMYGFNGLDLCGNLVLYNNLLLKQNGTGANTWVYSSFNGNIGINVPAPMAILDISGSYKQTIDVHSRQEENINVLARNVNNRGISLYANTSSSRVGFHNDHAINDTTPDAKIEYTSGGNLTLDVSNNTLIRSRLAVSSIGQTAHLLNETAILYDASASQTAYLFNTYENTALRTGQTLTLVSTDNSSNTFMNIVAPNKSGLALGGGNYVGDSTRSMGTIGIRLEDQYYPALNLVSGKSRLQYKQTVGINTHAPMADQYVVDVNGPIHVTNGEITIMNRADFEIIKMNLSRTHPLYGIAIGTPYLVTTNQKYRQKVLYTVDGGQNWNTSLDLSGSFPEEALSIWKDVFVFDNSLGFIVSDNGSAPIYYTTNSGVSWYPISGIEQSINSIYVSNTKRVFVALEDRSINWFDCPVTIYNSSGFLAGFGVDSGTIDVSTIFSRIIQIGGYNNTLFIIGESNSQYGVSIISDINTTPVNPNNIIHQQSGVYKSLYVLTDQTAVVVGTNVISYTNNLNTWTNVPTSYALNSVFMYNAQTSVAVGENGTIAYSLNGNQTWNALSVGSIRSSGTESQLLNPAYSLTNVVMTNLHNIIVSQTIRSFVWNFSTNIYGISKIINGFLPNVFDNPHNYVLDLSGSARISGDICISDGGKLTTTNDTVYLVNENAHTVFIGNDASLISIGNNTQGQTLINRNLQVHNDSSLNAQLSVGGNTRLYQSLLVDKDASFNANVSVASDTHLYGNLSVFNPATLRSRTYFLDDVSFNANLVSLRDASFNGRVSVGGAAVFSGPLYATGDVSLNANVVALRDASFNGRVSVGGAAVFSGPLYANNDVSLNANLVVLRDSSFNGNVSIGGTFTLLNDLSLNSNLYVLRDASFNGKLYSNTAVFSGPLYAASDVSLNANLFVLGDASYNSRLRVGGPLYAMSDVSLNANLFVLGDASYNSRLRVGGPLYAASDVSLNANLFVLGDASFHNHVRVGGPLYAASDVSLNANLFVLGDASYNSRLHVGGPLYAMSDVSLNANLFVIGDASYNSRLHVGGPLYAASDVSLNADLFVLGDASFNSSIRVVGNASINGALGVAGNSLLNGNLAVVNDTSFNGIISIDGTTTLHSNLYALSDACFNGNVVVQKDQTNTGNLYVGQNTTVNNSLTVRNVVYSKYFEGSGNNTDIFIGGLGLTTNDGSTTPFRTISIGSSGGIQNTQNIIRIGGGNDTIIFGGGNSGIGIEKINAGKYIFVNKVGNIGTANSSSDAGLYIVDNSNDYAGYIAVSKDMLGYKFKAPSNVSDPNILKININDMVLPSGISTGLVSLKRTSPISAYEVDSSFTLAVGTFDISNVLLKTYSPTYDSQNIQIIDTSLGILGNAYVLNHFSVGKTAASPANAVDISGILYTDKIAVSTASTNPNYQVEVSGNMFQSNGFIWQF
jgi:predicted acyltransferase (DUF342 family)